MAHYLKVVNGIVARVIVADSDFFNTFIDDSPGNWIESSEGSAGDTYDVARNAFVAPKPYPSYVLDESTNVWQPPVAHPADGSSYGWNESTTAWEAI